VLPSTGEAFGIAALEAIKLEVPIIVFQDVGGPLEFIHDGEDGFVVQTEGDLARKINDLTRGNIGNARTNGYNSTAWDILAYAERIKEIYKELTASQD